MSKKTTSSPSEKDKQSDQKFDLKKVFAAFAGLPRVLRLVWSASPPLTLGMAAVTLVSSLLPVATTIITGLLLDGVIAGFRLHTLDPVWLPVILQLFVTLLSGVCSTFHTMLQALLGERVENHVHLLILRKANTLDLSFFEDAEFYDKLRNASQEANNKPIMIIWQSFGLIQSTITLIGMLGILSRLQWWIVLVALGVSIPSFIADSRYGLSNYWRMRWQAPEKRQQWYVEQVMTFDTYNKEVKLFNLGNFFIKRYQELALKFYKQNKNLQVSRNLVSLLWSSLSVIVNSSIYLYVALQAVLGRISIGNLSQYTMAVNQTSQNFQNMLSGVSDVYENNLFVNTLFEFLEYEPKIVSPQLPATIEMPSDVRGLDIEFRNVTFTYTGKEQPALKNVSFSLRAGETIALVGSNGAGKTTLVKLLTRLYDPDEGEVLIGGRNVKEYALEDLREHIGVIFQDYVRYSMKARENIGVGRVADIENRELVVSAASKSGADTAIEKLDDGYETTLGRMFNKGVELSGGEWQKMALARAFMRDAPILILDEPTSALDAQAEYDVFQQFRTLTEGRTAIFISHRFSTVRLADRILVIENGTVIENGSHDTLIEL
ncbi:MAG TPA: ABC transporter ATP-binding protein, partial [Ktedonobacteraceae bacterium]|nr:ABC transporter ATP-binding protein [Ktedonobacteraceae bacterium]